MSLINVNENWVKYFYILKLLVYILYGVFYDII